MTEKRIKCRSCGYPMRVLTETEDGYECYCAECKMDRYVEKYSFKQFLRDIERGKGIYNEDLIDLYQRQDKKIKLLEKENEQLKQQNRQLKHWNKCLAEKKLQSYGYYTDSKAEKRVKDLFEHKPLNCSDKIKR